MTLPVEHLEGKYEILAKLAQGGMGTVYKVRHAYLDELRVIKVLRAGLKGDPELEERFVREARLATRLRHPNLAQLYDFSVDDEGNATIVLEFIHGLTLEDLLARHGPPPLGLALEIARQSLRAIGYLHRRHFVHRDISPDNLMLSRDVDGRPLVKLIDLGLAKALEADGAGLTMTGMFLGKVRYTSPEQLESQDLDGRSDLYAFGVVLYELLTGRCPIAGTTPPNIIAGHLLHPPLPFAETDPGGRVPAELRQVVLRALEKKRRDRFPGAEVFARRLATLQRRFPLADPEVAAALDRLSPELTRGPAAEPVTGERGGPAPWPPPEPAGGGETVTRILDPEVEGLLAGARTAREIDRLLERGDLDLADRRLGLAVAELGPQEVFDVLHQRLAELRRLGEDAETAETRPLELPEPEPPAPEVTETKLLEPEPEEPSSPEPPTPGWEPPAPPPRGRWKWVAAAAVVLLLIIAGIRSLRPPDAGTPATVDSAATENTGLPAPPNLGSAILDASPWGEVLEVVDARGNPQPLPPERSTPLVLSLAPGRYEAFLVHPDFDGRRSCELAVVAGGEVRASVVFESIDADAYFRQVGW